jgi:hypothetical protein
LNRLIVGVIFIDENGDAGPGVPLRKRHGSAERRFIAS